MKNIETVTVAACATVRATSHQAPNHQYAHAPAAGSASPQLPAWAVRPGGIIGLCDAGYGDNFCLAADELEALADELGLVMLQDTLRLDASESVTPEQDAVPWLQEFAELLVAWSS